MLLLEETLTETARPGQAKTVTMCMSYFTTGDPGKEHGTNKPPPKGRTRERSKRERRRHMSTCCLGRQPPRMLPAGIHLG